MRAYIQTLGAACCAFALACSFDSGGGGQPDVDTFGETDTDNAEGSSTDPTLPPAVTGPITAQPLDDSGSSEGTAGSGDDDWWDDSWEFRRRIEFVDPPEVDLGTFPLLVFLNADNFPVDDLLPRGQDLRFIQGDGTELPFDIERFNAQSTSAIWVWLPNTTAATSDLWVYWGNPNGADISSGSAVFGADYLAVWHMAEYPLAGINDSTGSGAVAVPEGMEASDRVEGWVGDAWRFDGDDNLMTIPIAGALDNVPGLMIEVWALIEEATGDAVCRGGDFGTDVFCVDVQNGSLRVSLSTDGISPMTATYVADTPVEVGQWAYLTFTWDANASEVRLHVNGELAMQKFHTGDTLTASTQPITIGASPQSNFYFTGVLDELRVSTIPRHRDWIALQHRSMSDGLIGFGPIEPRP